jgi:hypothetical protein
MKGVAFLVLGLLAGLSLLLRYPSLITSFLLLVTVWAFCRFYYFAFYVIEHYVDPTFRFSSLSSLAHYALRRKEPRGL